MKILPIGKGGFQGGALLSDEDYEDALQHSWWLGSHGYPVTNIIWTNGKRRTVRLHEFVMRNIERPKGHQIDHKNHIPTDCRRSNLRIVSRYQQMWNRLKTYKRKTTSKYKGVFATKVNDKNPWAASIGHLHRRYFLGFYPTEEDAAAAYNHKAKELFGKYALLNKID